MAGDEEQLMDFYPYRNRFQTYQRFEPRGRDRQDILDELRTMATEEDRIAVAGREFGPDLPRRSRPLRVPDRSVPP